MVVVSTLKTPLMDRILSDLPFLEKYEPVSEGNRRIPALSDRSFSGELGTELGAEWGWTDTGTGGDPGDPGTTDLLFLRKRLERILELVLRPCCPWRELAVGLPGVEGLTAACCGGSRVKLVGSENLLLAIWMSIVWGRFMSLKTMLLVSAAAGRGASLLGRGGSGTGCDSDSRPGLEEKARGEEGVGVEAVGVVGGELEGDVGAE